MKLYLPTSAGAYKDNAKTLRGTSQRTVMWLMVAMIIACAFMPMMAHAEPWNDAAQKVVEIFTGGLARTLAIIGIICCGVLALFGRLSWEWAIKIIIGIVFIFGSATIVDYIISASGG